MKIRFCCNNGANVHSKRCEEYDAERLGFSESEWEALSDKEKDKLVEEWAMERFEWWWEPVDD